MHVLRSLFEPPPLHTVIHSLVFLFFLPLTAMEEAVTNRQVHSPASPMSTAHMGPLWHWTSTLAQPSVGETLVPSVVPKEGEGEKQQIGTLRGPAQVSPDMILASIARSSQMRLNSDSYEPWGSAQSCKREMHFVMFFFTALMSNVDSAKNTRFARTT